MSELVPETFAEQQLANARSDPRLERDEKAMVADWREGSRGARAGARLRDLFYL